MKYHLQQLQNTLLNWLVSRDSRQYPRQKISVLQSVVGSVFFLLAAATNHVTAQPFAYITNTTANTVTVINTANNLVVTTIPVGTGPFGVAVKPDGSRVYIANSGSGSVSIINAINNTVLTTVAVGAGPNGVAISPDGSRVYVTNNTANSVSVIDTAMNTVVTTITGGFTSPLGVVVNTAGTRVFVTNNVFPGTVSVIDTSTNMLLAPIALSPASAGNSPYGIAVSPSGAFIYVVNGGSNDVVVIDATTGFILTTFTPPGIAPLAVAINPASTRAYITNFTSGSITVVDTTTHTVLTTISIGSVNLNGISINPAGTFAYVADQTAQNVRVINLATNMLSANVAAGSGTSAFGQFIALVPPPPVAGVCQFIPAMGAWNVASNWGGDCLMPNRVPGALDRAEIVNKTATLPLGTTIVGDLYLGGSTINGNNATANDSTLNVVAANNIAGGIAWGSNSYTFNNMTLQLRATGANPVAAANAPIVLNNTVVLLYDKGANFGSGMVSNLSNNAKINTADMTAQFLMSGSFSLADTSSFMGSMTIVENLSVGLSANANMQIGGKLTLSSKTLSFLNDSINRLTFAPGAVIKGAGTINATVGTLTFPNDGMGQRLVSDSVTITVPSVFNGSVTLRPNDISGPGGIIVINGSYTQTGTGKIQNISNYASNNGNVTINGVATLGGTLEVVLDGFSPNPPFTLNSNLAYTSRLGTFNSVIVLPAGYFFTTTYSESSIALELLEPITTINPTMHSYPSAVYGNFATQTFTVTNNSGLASTMFNTSTAFTGTDKSDFAIFADNCTGIVANGATCTIEVHFLPLTHPVGLKEANFGITINGLTAVTALSGTTLSPASGWLAPSGDTTIAIPGPTPVGSTSSIGVMFFNVGSMPITIDSIASAPPLSSNIGGCAAPFAPNASCIVTFSLTAGALASFAGQYSVSSLVPGNTFSMFGTGSGTNTLAPTVVTTVLPANITLGSTATATLTITNPNTIITLNTISVTSKLTVGQLQVAPPANITFTPGCGMPEVTAFPGATTASIAISSLAPLATCTFSYDLKSSNTTGVWTVGSNAVSSTEASANVISGFVNVTVLDALPPPAPTTLSFGNVSTSTSSLAQTVTVTNPNASPLAVTSISFTQPNFQYTTTGACATTIDPNSVCVYSIKFRPVSLGSIMGNFNLATSIGSISVPMAGTGVVQGLTILPTMNNFGNVTLGQLSTVSTINISNAAGTGSAIFDTITIGGVDATDFTLVSHTCAGGLAAGATCTADVRFNPTSAVGAKSASLQLNFAPGSSSVSLSGTATAASVGVSPTSFNFGNVTVNTTSASQTFTITNSTGVAGVPSVFVPTPFTNIGTGTCGVSLAPLATCTFIIAFAPTMITPSNSNITFSVGPTLSALTTLTGTGVAALVAPTITSAPALPAGTISIGYSTTLVATGSPTITWSVTMGALPAGLNLSPAGVVSGTPSAAGIFNFTIQAANGTMPNASQMFSLTIGNGLSFTPANFTFGNTALGTASARQIVTISNATGAAITINMTSNTPGEFGHYLPSCGMSIPAMGACTIEIDFSPTPMSMLGAFMGVLTINTTAGNLVVPLAGNAVAYNVSNDGNLAFANTVIAQTSANQTVTYTNNATGTANVLSLSIVGTDPSQFQLISNTCVPGPVNAMATCTATVSFAPTSVGAKSASLQLNYASSVNFSVGLSGTAIAVPVAPTITSAPALPSATVNLTYTTTLVASGSPTITWSVTMGALPAGLNLSTAGILSGTPTAAGTFNFTVQAANGTMPNASQMVSIVIAPPAILPVMVVTIAPTTVAPATDAVVTLTLSLSAVDMFAQLIASGSVTMPIGLVVQAAPAPTNTCSTFTNILTMGSGISFGMGNIPAMGSCTITFTVRAAVANTYIINIPAGAITANLANTNTSNATLMVSSGVAPLFTSGPTYPAGTVGSPYSTTFAASGSPASTWSVTIGTPPAGLTLNSVTGVLSGTPTAVGVTNFTVQAANGTMPNATQMVTITVVAVGAIPVITSAPPPSGLTGQAYSFTPSATGTAPIAWSIVSGGLPSGLTISPTNGQISGTPTGSGLFTFTLRATNMAGQANQATSISITTAVIPTVSVSPNSLSFGNQNLGTVSPIQTVSVTNTGNGPFNINSITSVGDFAYTADCPASLAPMASCTLSFTFSPLTAGTLTGAASVNTSALAGSGGISLSGVGISVPRANIVINPSSLSFGDQAQGTTSAAQVIFISNTGLATLELRNIAFNASTSAPSFVLSAPPAGSLPSCGGSLAPATSCALGVSFAPSTTSTLGAQTAGITITHNSTPTGSQGTSGISLNGNATARREAIIRLSGQPSFADQILGTVSIAQAISVTNTGTIDLNVGALSITPTNANSISSDFQASSGCGTLIPNANCTINVSFSPSGDIGIKAATISVASNASNASAGAISLSANAIAIPTPVVRLSATSAGFGTAIVGGATSSQAITLSNVGGLPLLINSIGISGDYGQTNTCPVPPAALNRNQSCSINITFTPRTLGSRAGSLTISSNATPPTNTVPLSGAGCRFLTPQQQLRLLSSCE